MLVINPNPADANEYAPFMKDEINMKVVAEIHDEHAQVVSHSIILIIIQLLLDLGSLPSIYRYPNLVISCQDKEDNAMYSSVYGRLLIDRAMKAGLLKEETESVYIPVETKHRIKNATDKMMVFVEVQTGDNLDENDIVRFEDKYGRIS